MHVHVSRQGLRRLTLLNPSTAFHDSLSPACSVTKFPRVVLDKLREDVSKHHRRKLEKERDIKKFGKLGVSRTKIHGIPDLIDCEYAGLSNLAQGINMAVSSAGSVNVDMFLQQASERLKKDADLIEINELISIVTKMVSVNFYDLGLMNKVKNEVLYDIERVHAPELASLLNSFALLNIVSPKLINAAFSRMKDITDSSNHVDSVSISTLLKSIKKLPAELIRKNSTHISFLLNVLSTKDELTFPELISLANVLFLVSQRTKISGRWDEKKLIHVSASRNVTDIESAAQALFLCWKWQIKNPEILDKLVDFATKNANQVIEDTCDYADSISLDGIEKRNRAINIAAEIFFAANQMSLTSLRDLYRPAFTAYSVKGFNCRNLIGISRIIDDDFIKHEIHRKINSFSQQQRSLLVN